jgi:hypothetical protein
MFGRLAGGARLFALAGLVATVIGVPAASAYDIRDYRAAPQTVPQARPGQPGFIPPTLMHLDPCGDRVEGQSWDDLEDYWEEIEDRAEEAYEEAIDDKMSPDQALVFTGRETAEESVEEGGNRWDAALAAAAGVRFNGGSVEVMGKAAYDAIVRYGGGTTEADDAASWAIERLSGVPAEWEDERMIRHDRWCTRSYQEVQINIDRKIDLARRERLYTYPRYYYDPFYTGPYIGFRFGYPRWHYWRHHRYRRHRR